MQCDICDKPGMGRLISAREFSRAVGNGFNPFQEGLASDRPYALLGLRGQAAYDYWRDSAISGLASVSDWNVCHTCMVHLEKYLHYAGASGD
jgi:hypothetical protein